jgi:circadian clock protein KaiC
MQKTFPKALSGIAGLDEITHGGLPANRPTLVCGGPGCGKTILAMEFLVRGALEFGEPGLFVSFEENPEQLIENFRSLGFDLADLIAKKKLIISHISLARGEIIEAGAFSFDALFLRLERAIAEVGARRVVLDTMEALFSEFSNSGTLRNEVVRLFQWLRDRKVAAIVTGERGKEQLTQRGFEEYISDCVILLDQRVSDQTTKRRLRIIKYRGSGHASDEFPFFIGDTGFSVLPITSLNLDHRTYTERVRTGIAGLDAMFGGKGFFKGSTVLVTGKSGTGKSSIAAAFASAACARGERCLYFSFEESAAQLTRNMSSLGFDLDSLVKKKCLTISAFRPNFRGLEEHLVEVARRTEKVNPTCVVLDPITNFVTVADSTEVKAMLLRMLDFLKRRGVTLMMTALTPGSGLAEETQMLVSSLVDAWIAVEVERKGDTRRRTLSIIKSRGMKHSQETPEFVMSSNGLAVRKRGKKGSS